MAQGRWLILFAWFITSTAAIPAVPQILLVGNGAEPESLDPHLVSGDVESHILTNLFEGLVTKHPQDLAIQPGVAVSWKVSPDRKTYTFILRPDAKWSDGTPVLASDFVYSWQRLLNPQTGAKYASIAYFIKNAQKLNEGKMTDFSKLGARAKDNLTLVVELERPTPYFLQVLSHFSLLPVPKQAVEKHKEKWINSGNMVSNGAFTMIEWTPHKIIRAKRSETYWDKAKVKLEEVHFIPVETADTEEKMFRAGKLHLTMTIPPEKVPFWSQDKTGVYRRTPSLAVYFYSFNTTKAPFNDLRIRRAFSLAVDRKILVEQVTRAGQQPASALTPAGCGGYTPPTLLPLGSEKVAEAQALLKEAGFPGGNGLPPISLMFNTHESHKKIAEAIQQMWKKNLGVEVSLYNQEWKVALAALRTGDFQIARSSWAADYNDPISFLGNFTPISGTNYTGWKDPQYQKLVDKIDAVEGKKRMQAIAEAETYFIDKMPVIPLYSYTTNRLVKKEVKGWYTNLQDHHPFKEVYLEAN